MAYDPKIHHRRSIRLRGYDYAAPGAYFITVVTHLRTEVFGEIMNAEMDLNVFGGIAADCWRAIPEHFPAAAIDEFIVMPNHVHGIVIITAVDIGVGAQHCCAPTRIRSNQFQRRHVPQTNVQPGSISAIVRSYKSAVTTRINEINGTPGAPVWQRNYWEHIIRDEIELSRIREYIHNNPIQWEIDAENRLPNQPRKCNPTFG